MQSEDDRGQKCTYRTRRAVLAHAVRCHKESQYWNGGDLAIGRQNMQMQVDKIVGKGAPTEFIEQLEDLVNMHHERVEVDVIRAYHFGARFIVEVRL